jgi:hypothetical protein
MGNDFSDVSDIIDRLRKLLENSNSAKIEAQKEKEEEEFKEVCSVRVRREIAEHIKRNMKRVQLTNGTQVSAFCMTSAAYDSIWYTDTPNRVTSVTDGYLVVFPEIESNTEYFDGYVTWISKDSFEIVNDAMQSNVAENSDTGDYISFSDAVIYMKYGGFISRKGLDGSLAVMADSSVSDKTDSIVLKQHIMLIQDGFAEPYTFTNADVFSDSWYVCDIS